MENRINLQPEQSALYARELEPLLALYLEDMALRVSAASLHNYRYALTMYGYP